MYYSSVKKKWVYIYGFQKTYFHVKKLFNNIASLNPRYMLEENELLPIARFTPSCRTAYTLPSYVKSRQVNMARSAVIFLSVCLRFFMLAMLSSNFLMSKLFPISKQTQDWIQSWPTIRGNRMNLTIVVLRMSTPGFDDRYEKL